jgi:molybdopterin biosynthesis enzyme
MTAHRTPSLVSVADILSSLSREARPLDARRTPLEQAVGGILAEPLLVEMPVPSEPTALRSGYAVAASDLVGASPYSPLILPEEPPTVEAGGALPPGADAVLPPDAVTRHGSLVEVAAGVSPGENVCRRGEDASPGAVLRAKGEPFRLPDSAVARAAGLSHAVVRRPCVGFVFEAGGTIDLRVASLWLGIVGDIVPLLPGNILDPAAAPVDLLVLATHDVALAERVLDQADRIVARGIALRPGETAQVALAGGRPVVIVPPRLDVLFTVSRCILQPFLRHIAGGLPHRGRRLGPLVRKLSSSIGFTEVALLRDAEHGIEPLGIGVLGLSALAGAQYWCAMPPESEGRQAGDTVDAFDI